MNTENVTIFAGEDRTLTFHGRDSSNNPVSLTGKTITWYVGRDPLYRNERDTVALLTKAGVVTGASSGTFTVTLTATDTEGMFGDYEYMAKATTTATGALAVICAGRFRVQPVLSPDI